jgi:predicted enzyme related to lactoylglutathione lyase
VIEHLFTAVPVRQYQAAVEWYTRLFGRAPDVIVKEDECMWQVAGNGWVYVVLDQGRAGNCKLTLLVGNLEEFIADLAARGIMINLEIEIEPGMFKRTEITDPDGNAIALGEDLSS